MRTRSVRVHYFLNFCMHILVFRYNISFIDPPPGGFGEIFPSVMIFSVMISSLREIFRRIPVASGL